MNGAAEEKALKDIVAYVSLQRQRGIGVDGYTYSDPNAFFGRWWSSDAQGWLADHIVLLLVDFKIDLTDPRFSLTEEIAKLKDVVHAAYAKYGRPQEEVWIVSHRITRVF